jgi:hypothetical protein
MQNNIEKKPMPKWLLYGLFILKFLLGLVLIYWTIYMTMQSDVGKDSDNAFLSTYQNVDANYNNMIKENLDFSKNYNIKFVLNNNEIIGLSLEDIYLSQRIIKDRKIRKDMLKVGENSLTVLVQDKDGNSIENKIVDILITKNNTHQFDVNLNYKNKNKKQFNIDSIGYWNITGIIKIDGKKGSFYIKTNAKKQ